MLKSFIKFHYQVVIPLGQNLEPKSHQPEPQLQAYDLIKRCHKISNCNGFESLSDKSDEKLGMGWNDVENLGSQINSTK